MSNKRRSRLELVYDILLSIQNKGGKIKPTHLMYKSNLSHKLLNAYLDELLGKELVQIEEVYHKKRKTNSKIIALTDKGSGFLAEFRRMREFTDAFGL
ncbi:MAG TPA: winged helix-turn-helix domain-containing protein [Candidatus Nanoarchaeia archaeon]|nr:winged helix-turn-helix domain-containing protein [Candidatus Nanoarchaeia archaeon]